MGCVVINGCIVSMKGGAELTEQERQILAAYISYLKEHSKPIAANGFAGLFGFSNTGTGTKEPVKTKKIKAKEAKAK